MLISGNTRIVKEPIGKINENILKILNEIAVKTEIFKKITEKN